MTNTTKEKKTLMKYIKKKSLKVLIPILGLMKYPVSNIQALFIKTNLVISTLHLFQISLKFQNETKHLIIVFWKPCKKKLCI